MDREIRISVVRDAYNKVLTWINNVHSLIGKNPLGELPVETFDLDNGPNPEDLNIISLALGDDSLYDGYAVRPTDICTLPNGLELDELVVRAPQEVTDLEDLVGNTVADWMDDTDWDDTDVVTVLVVPV
jgi:hypothetical protein